METKPTTIEQHERSLGTPESNESLLLKTHGSSLSDESLQTLLLEVEPIINLHPLTTIMSPT